MTRRSLPRALVLAALLLSGACSPGRGSSRESVPPSSGEIDLEFTFPDDLQGWVAGFADYPVGQETFYQLTSGYLPLPLGLGVPADAPFISGDNHSDDLFMFWKRRLGPQDGLRPEAAYDVRFTITIATEAASGCTGIGGAPGEGVFVKAGAADVEPVAVDSAGTYRMNIDIGSQATGGTDAMVLGDVANSSTDCSAWVWEFKTLDSSGIPFTVTADPLGTVWLIVGSDSGYEGATRLYYSRIQVVLTPR